MFNARSLSFAIRDSTQVGEARRAAAQLAERAGLDEDAAGKLAIIVTELANNLHKHAQEGSLLLRQFADRDAGVEVLAVDKGPGMNVERSFRDGFSTTGTPGTGLGAVTRLAHAWDVYSAPGGTVVMARLNSTGAHQPSRFLSGSVCLPVRGEVLCGDNWARSNRVQHERILVVDGLGHGQHAAEAADEAEELFLQSTASTLPELMQATHNALKKTRGAAASFAEFDVNHRVVRYVGIGNISATILHQGKTRSLVSQNGTVGHEARKIQEFQYPWPEGSIIVMNSDGLQSKWDVSKYPGLALRHPALLAGVLWRDFTRGRDDVTVVALVEATR